MAIGDVTGHAILEKGVFLGSHASITPGVRVGEFAVVGAGSVAFRNDRAGQTLLGVPWKITFVLGTTSTTNQELIQLFAEALETEASSIDPEKAIAEYAEWDSLAWLTIMSLLDERYGIRLTGKEIRGFVTVNDVIENVTAKASVA